MQVSREQPGCGIIHNYVEDRFQFNRSHCVVVINSSHDICNSALSSSLQHKYSKIYDCFDATMMSCSVFFVLCYRELQKCPLCLVQYVLCCLNAHDVLFSMFCVVL
jgi:hypothetical protein